MLDLGLVIDSSTSIEEDGYEEQRRFLITLINSLTIDNGDVRVGAVQFSDRARLEFYLNRYRSQSEIIGNINTMTYIKGETNIAEALRLTREQIFRPSNGDRTGVRNVALVITDANSNVEAFRTIPEADLLKASSAIIISVGVGLIDLDELTRIASRPGLVLQVDDYAGLRNRLPEILDRICNEPGNDRNVCNSHIVVAQHVLWARVLF